jgi:hypothetical protein
MSKAEKVCITFLVIFWGGLIILAAIEGDFSTICLIVSGWVMFMFIVFGGQRTSRRRR